MCCIPSCIPPLYEVWPDQHGDVGVHVLGEEGGRVDVLHIGDAVDRILWREKKDGSKRITLLVTEGPRLFRYRPLMSLASYHGMLGCMCLGKNV